MKAASVAKSSVRVKLGDISVEEKSGWRPKDDLRISFLALEFRAGRYGQLTRSFHGFPTSCTVIILHSTVSVSCISGLAHFFNQSCNCSVPCWLYVLES